VIVTLEAEPDPEPPLVSVTDPSVTSAATEAAGEAEQKAARRLGVPALLAESGPNPRSKAGVLHSRLAGDKHYASTARQSSG